MTIDRIKSLVSEDFDAVNNLIINNIQSQVDLIDDLSNHIIQSGGKRLRPLIVLLASHACGYRGELHISLAAMIEYFHTATLLHDDVVDESTLRRGRQTANSIWGSKASILVGDYLFNQSYQIMLDVGNSDIMQLMADTFNQISCGELRQLSNRHNPSLSYEEYFEVIKAKTALLFAASASIGAHISQQGKEFEQNFYAYGLHLGNAFQLIDDALDYCSDAETMGKNVGDDLADGKATLPLLYALEHGNGIQQEQIRKSLQQGSLEYLNEIREAITETNAIDYTREFAKKEAEKAVAALQVLPDSLYKEALFELAYYAVERIH